MSNTLNKILFIVGVVLQFSVLLFMIIKKENTLKYGTVIYLKCEPIDPRSLLSGDYVILNYKISRFNEIEFKSLNKLNENYKENDTVYVALKKINKKKNGSSAQFEYWTAKEISHNFDKLKENHSVIIKGIMISKYNNRIKYGVEQYFVPQFKGKEIESNILNTSVEISIAKDGDSAIKKLFIDEEEVKFQ